MMNELNWATLFQLKVIENNKQSICVCVHLIVVNTEYFYVLSMDIEKWTSKPIPEKKEAKSNISTISVHEIYRQNNK